MPTFDMMVTETYTLCFSVEADDADRAVELAEEMAIERAFPSDHHESCIRAVDLASCDLVVAHTSA